MPISPKCLSYPAVWRMVRVTRSPQIIEEWINGYARQADSAVEGAFGLRLSFRRKVDFGLFPENQVNGGEFGFEKIQI